MDSFGLILLIIIVSEGSCIGQSIASVSLVGGPQPGMGKAMITLKDGRTGPVCLRYNLRNVAEAMCAHLGYSGRSTHAYRFGSKPNTLPGVMKVYSCNKGEQSIDKCPHDIGTFQCYAVLGVVCVIHNVTVKLAGGHGSKSGTVQLSINGITGTISGIDKSANYGRDPLTGNAQVLCRMLGYSGVSVYYRDAYFGKGTGVLWTSSRCYGSTAEKNILDCFPTAPVKWDHSNDAGIACDVQKYLEFYLASDAGGAEGQVQFRVNGTGGYVCGTRWGSNEATVTCRMLGYRKGITTTKDYGGHARIKDYNILNIKCQGHESRLQECDIYMTSSEQEYLRCKTSYAAVVCSQKSNGCSDPAGVYNSKVTDRIVYNQRTLTYTCKAGYTQRSGDRQRICKLDGTWSGTAPVCSGVTASPAVPSAAYPKEKESSVRSITPPVIVGSTTPSLTVASGRTNSVDESSVSFQSSGSSIGVTKQGSENNNPVTLANSDSHTAATGQTGASSSANTGIIAGTISSLAVFLIIIILLVLYILLMRKKQNKDRVEHDGYEVPIPAPFHVQKQGNTYGGHAYDKSDGGARPDDSRYLEGPSDPLYQEIPEKDQMEMEESVKPNAGVGGRKIPIPAPVNMHKQGNTDGHVNYSQDGGACQVDLHDQEELPGYQEIQEMDQKDKEENVKSTAGVEGCAIPIPEPVHMHRQANTDDRHVCESGDSGARQDHSNDQGVLPDYLILEEVDQKDVERNPEHELNKAPCQPAPPACEIMYDDTE